MSRDPVDIGKLRQDAEKRRAAEAERNATEIFYKGFAYNVRSQWGIDSLKSAIKRNKDE